MDKRLIFNNTNLSSNAVSQPIRMEEDTVGSKVPRSVMPKGSITHGGAIAAQPDIDLQKERDNRSICVRNLDYSITKEQLEQLFSTVGDVKTVTIPVDKAGKPKAYAYIELDSVESRERAVTSLTGSKLNDREITVEKKRTNKMGLAKKSNSGNAQLSKLLFTMAKTLSRGGYGGHRGGASRGGAPRGRGGR
ncbi:RNA-binding protein SGN1, putative [Entamoeba invadens IP1]|uniref:RNA-binding protein SGN1, putative n=1 Tax=Entamoeba invadens IP1 TaxID=370355 RepID=A0A0A1UE71_ENTIV|nr:RNA-binding protein SGN1, putative [Entamoeba invadens IP1]ELP94788.1 RNA-binding protein SGN1, putative [Entamoeba invadens IP1]|eukprot:XP_004261559.1 RNA-binding protein SGN1, putative [Entamoeba invadens IP1]